MCMNKKTRKIGEVRKKVEAYKRRTREGCSFYC